MNALLLTLLGLAFVVFLVLIYVGVFHPIYIKVCKPPFQTGGHYFYKFYQTFYSDAGQAFRSINKLPLKQPFQCLGIYYDDPEKVEAEKTRFTVGVILSDEDFTEEFALTMQNVGFEHIKLPNVGSVVLTSFPLRSIISILVAIGRVYPKMKSFVQKERLDPRPCMEYYPSDRTEMHFVSPLEKNDEFYVPEYHTASVE